MKKGTSYFVITAAAAVSLACSSASAKTDTGNTSRAQAHVAGSAQILMDNLERYVAPSVLPITDATPRNAAPIKDEPAKLVREFYAYYLDGFPSVEDERIVFAKYLTDRFLSDAIEAWDADLFLDAQDIDETWKKNFTVSPAAIAGNKATVKVNLRGKTFKWVLKVSLVKKGTAWKIDGVKNVHS